MKYLCKKLLPLGLVLALGLCATLIGVAEEISDSPTKSEAQPFEPPPEISPAPMVEPTLEHTLEPTPEPSPVSSLEPTSEPSPVSSPVSSPESTPEPSPASTLEPTPEPSPVSSLEPTAEPTPELIPLPTAESPEILAPSESPSPTEAIPELKSETNGIADILAPDRSISIYAYWNSRELQFGQQATLYAELEGYERANCTIQWQTSPDNATWTDVAGGTGEAFTTTVTEANYRDYWRVKVTILGALAADAAEGGAST